MNGLRARAAFDLVMCVAVAIVGFELLNGPIRHVEISSVLLVAHHGGPPVSAVGGYAIQVLPNAGLPFRAQVTPFCSSVIALLAMAGIGLFVLHGPVARRLVAVSVAIAFVFACNVARIAASLVVGAHMGDRALVLFHDWVGTLFGLAYTIVGFLLMLYGLLPRSGPMKKRLFRRAIVRVGTDGGPSPAGGAR